MLRSGPVLSPGWPLASGKLGAGVGVLLNGSVENWQWRAAVDQVEAKP